MKQFHLLTAATWMFTLAQGADGRAAKFYDKNDDNKWKHIKMHSYESFLGVDSSIPGTDDGWKHPWKRLASLFDYYYSSVFGVNDDNVPVRVFTHGDDYDRQEEVNKMSNLQWKLEAVGDGSYRIRCKFGDEKEEGKKPSLYLTRDGNYDKETVDAWMPNNHVRLHELNDSWASQRWYLKIVGGIIPDYVIVNGKKTNLGPDRTDILAIISAWDYNPNDDTNENNNGFCLRSDYYDDYIDSRDDMTSDAATITTTVIKTDIPFLSECSLEFRKNAQGWIIADV